MKFSRKTNKRSDIPSFREFLYQEKILRESGIIEDNEINYESKTSDISKERPSEKNSAKKQIYNDYNKNQIKAINLEKYKLIKENGLLKEELENYRKSLEKKELNDSIISSKDEKISELEKEIKRLKINNESSKKEKEKEKEEENYIPNGIVNDDLEEKNRLNKIIDELKTKVKDLNEHKNRMELKINELKSKLEENDEEKNGLNKTIDDLKIKLEKSNKSYKFRKI